MMKRTYTFARKIGMVDYSSPKGGVLRIPVFPGIFKHPSIQQLPRLLSTEEGVRKYTREALRRAPWQVLREFPASLLRDHMEEAQLRPARLRALRFLLSGQESPPP